MPPTVMIKNSQFDATESNPGELLSIPKKLKKQKLDVQIFAKSIIKSKICVNRNLKNMFLTNFTASAYLDSDGIIR